jgi:hypothetical protein
MGRRRGVADIVPGQPAAPAQRAQELGRATDAQRPRARARDRGLVAQRLPPAAHVQLRRGLLPAQGRSDLACGGGARNEGLGRALLRRAHVAQTLAHHSDAPARYVLVCTPAGFERHRARIAAEAAGVEPPQWALRIPEVTVVLPQIAAQAWGRGSRARGTAGVERQATFTSSYRRVVQAMIAAGRAGTLANALGATHPS